MVFSFYLNFNRMFCNTPIPNRPRIPRVDNFFDSWLKFNWFVKILTELYCNIVNSPYSAVTALALIIGCPIIYSCTYVCICSLFMHIYECISSMSGNYTVLFLFL